MSYQRFQSPEQTKAAEERLCLIPVRAWEGTAIPAPWKTAGENGGDLVILWPLNSNYHTQPRAHSTALQTYLLVLFPGCEMLTAFSSKAAENLYSQIRIKWTCNTILPHIFACISKIIVFSSILEADLRGPEAIKNSELEAF